MMTLIQKVLEICKDIDHQADVEASLGHYDIEALLRQYAANLRKATLPEPAKVVDTPKKSIKETNDELERGGS